MAPTPANYDAVRLRRLDRAHHLHPFSNNRVIVEEGGGPIYTRAEGVYIWDIENKRYLDGMSGLWCVNVGYGRQELVEAAARQMQELPYYSSFFNSATPPIIELANKLTELTDGKLVRALFANSGSEANDTVAWLVRRYWDLVGKPTKKTLIARVNAYHGSTMMAASLGNWGKMHEQGGLPLPDVVHVRQPYWYGEGADMDPDTFGRLCAQAIEDKIKALGPDKVAAVIGEPVQGAGGVIIPPASYWPEVQRICRQYDVLLVADEVICGFGRTGRWFGHQTFGFEPDVVSAAKGLSSGYLPISAVLLAEKIAKVLVGSGDWLHGFTYSGHPVAAAVALKNIEIMERENLVEKVHSDVGPYFAERLATLTDHPLVGEVRTCGLLGAIELVEDKRSRRRFEPAGTAGAICRTHSFANGLIMRACVDTMVLSPPLILTRPQVDELVTSARQALDATKKELLV
jgi:putrescine aminotransferase